jgi:hypothetical protein
MFNVAYQPPALHHFIFIVRFLLLSLLGINTLAGCRIPPPTGTVSQADCTPSITMTRLPSHGSMEDLQGQVTCADPTAYQVAVAIFVDGWWSKPSFEQPTVPIQPDGTWTSDVTTGGTDPLATRFAAYLLPDGGTPPLLQGEPDLAAELQHLATAHTVVERSPGARTINFSGHTWYVKTSSDPVGPGPNVFSDHPEDVRVDDAGRLHLWIRQRQGQWSSSEVFSRELFGYGSYTFQLARRVDQLDKNVVLGLFTWDDTGETVHHREIDIEVSRWGEEDIANAQFVVQPWQQAANLSRFRLALNGDYSTHRFVWDRDQVTFASAHGHTRTPAQDNTIATWTYTGAGVPPAGRVNARINLWLLAGAPPSDGQPVEVIIDSFTYVPAE